MQLATGGQLLPLRSGAATGNGKQEMKKKPGSSPGRAHRVRVSSSAWLLHGTPFFSLKS
jgi:hypothetical protein